MFQIQPLLHNGNRHIGSNGDPDLCLDGVFGRAVKSLDSKMLFDPFEEQFHLPSLLVKSANRERGQREIVGQKFECLARFGIGKFDQPERFGVASTRLGACQLNVLIAHQSNLVPNWKGANRIGLHIGLRARHEESPGSVKVVESLEVDVGFVHDVKRASLDVALLAEQVEHFDVVHLAIADMDKTRNRTLQIYQRMKLDGRLRGSERCPIEQTQTQVDRRRIQRINGRAHQRVEIGARRFVGIKRARRFDQMVRQVCKHLPGSDAIGVGQRVARNSLATQPHVIEIFALRAQIDFDVAQRFPTGQLREGQHQKLVQTTEVLSFVLRSARSHHPAECLERQVGHHLSEYQLSCAHDQSRQKMTANDDLYWKSDLNRGHAKNRKYP